MAKRKKKKLKFKYRFLLFVLIVSFITFFIFYKLDIKSKSSLKDFISNNYLIDKAKILKQKKYQECIKNGLKEENFNDETHNKRNEIIHYATNQHLKYGYTDLTYNYSFAVDEQSSIYGASLIKLVDAIYIIDNNIDLNTTIKYEAKYKASSSQGMDKHKIGDMVSIRDLLTYAISVSDNTAHHMLLAYIGKNNMISYARGLGADVILVGGDDYGNQTIHDTQIYLKRAYELILTNENGQFLKEIMTNDYKNYLNVDNYATYAHKYGSYNSYFHNIGINFDSHPYSVSVLTNNGIESAKKTINNISKLSKEFNDLYYQNLESYCNQ